MGTVALPFYRWRLVGPRPKPGYPKSLQHLGHHLLKRRLDLGLMQKEVAELLGADPDSIRNWEVGRRAVAVRFYPALLKFLGYDPLPEPKTWGEQLVRARMRLGLSRKQLARRAGLDPGTAARLEAIASPQRGATTDRLLAVLCSIES